MKKKFLPIVFLLTIFLLATSCKQLTSKSVPKIFKNRSLKLSNVSVEAENDYKTNRDEKVSWSKENKSLIKKTVIHFIELAYLDLDIDENKKDFLDLFSKDTQTPVKSRFNEITIGKLGSKIDSVKDAKATIKSISIIWDKNNKPVIGLADFILSNVNYKSGSAKIAGKAEGSLVLAKQNGKYKIIDYRVIQKIQKQGREKKLAD